MSTQSSIRRQESRHPHRNMFDKYHYSFTYVDVKNPPVTVADFIAAENPVHALEIFIAKRKHEGWSLSDVLTNSNLTYLEEESETRFVVDKYGEPVPKALTPLM